MVYLSSLVSDNSGNEDGHSNNNYNVDEGSEKVATIVGAKEERVQGTLFVLVNQW